jgi:hypothetical protein
MLPELIQAFAEQSQRQRDDVDATGRARSAAWPKASRNRC